MFFIEVFVHLVSEALRPTHPSTDIARTSFEHLALSFSRLVLVIIHVFPSCRPSVCVFFYRLTETFAFWLVVDIRTRDGKGRVEGHVCLRKGLLI